MTDTADLTAPDETQARLTAAKDRHGAACKAVHADTDAFDAKLRQAIEELTSAMTAEFISTPERRALIAEQEAASAEFTAACVAADVAAGRV